MVCQAERRTSVVSVQTRATWCDNWDKLVLLCCEPCRSTQPICSQSSDECSWHSSGHEWDRLGACRTNLAALFWTCCNNQMSLAVTSFVFWHWCQDCSTPLHSMFVSDLLSTFARHMTKTNQGALISSIANDSISDKHSFGHLPDKPG